MACNLTEKIISCGFVFENEKIIMRGTEYTKKVIAFEEFLKQNLTEEEISLVPPGEIDEAIHLLVLINKQIQLLTEYTRIDN